MASQVNVLTDESLFRCLSKRVGCVLTVTSDTQTPLIIVYSDYEKQTQLGTIAGPVRLKIEQMQHKDGVLYGQVYLPADTVNGNWNSSTYAWVKIGTYTVNQGAKFNAYLVADSLQLIGGFKTKQSGMGNSEYVLWFQNNGYEDVIKTSTLTGSKAQTAMTDTYLVNQDQTINTSNINKVEEFSKNVNDVIDQNSGTVSEEDYYVEDFWIYDPTAFSNTSDPEQAMNEYNKAISAMTDITKLRYIFGLPYQFLPSADMRIEADRLDDDEIFGYTYAEKIGGRLPLLYMTPGNSRFLSDSSSKERSSAISNIIDVFTNKTGDSNLNDLLDGYSGKLYSLQPAYNEYFQYVNPMCRIGAVLLGLDMVGNAETKAIGGDDYRMIDGHYCSNYNWAWADNGDKGDIFEQDDETHTKFDSVAEKFTDALSWLYYRQVIPFYITSEPQFQDSFNNETTESSLASKVNGFSDSARELQFLLGTTSSVIAEDFDALGDVFANSRQAIEEFTQKISGHGGIFSSLLGSIKTVATGGRLMFPNIWSNSSYNKSYNISMKLTTPYYDVKSWWLNVFVPLCHLLGFVMPRGEYHNGYSAPFLVKAFYKGTFSIELGIITELTVQKGKEGGWTKDGLPTVVDVSFTIQDLYSTISMSPITLAKNNTLENIQELDYLCSLCGININEPDPVRIAKLYTTLNITSRVLDIPRNILGGPMQSITSKVSSIFTLL